MEALAVMISLASFMPVWLLYVFMPAAPQRRSSAADLQPRRPRSVRTSRGRLALRAGLAVLLAGMLPGARDLARANEAPTPLETVLSQRLAGDRTGACIAAALIEGERTTRARVCADASQPPRIGADDAFEIGSISKTMTATLLAGLINAGKASLDDPLSDWLPAGTKVPAWEGQPVRLRHVVTHSSGLPALPPGVAITDPADPYAGMDPDAVIGALAGVELKSAPGTRPAYSNFAMMLLSAGIAARTGTGFDQLLAERIFTPLGMKGAWVRQAPAGAKVAAGHLPTGAETPAWHFPRNMAGVGGVHATLDDMVRYVRAELPPDTETALGRAMALSQRKVEVPAPLAGAMNWFTREIGGQEILFHEGGTGGFSAFVAFAPGLERGVVLLADTSLTDLGGISDLGLHLLDSRVPVAPPRRAEPAPATLLEALAGDYVLEGGLPMRLDSEDGQLYIQAQGQPRFRMGHDSAGDFYPLEFSALLQPVEHEPGKWSFNWRQGGGIVAATRVQTVAAETPAIDPALLAAYTGRYTLLPGFELEVFAEDGVLHARATGQGAFALAPRSDDSFAAPAFGIRIDFTRDADGAVSALELHQGGQTLRGARQ